MAASAHLPVHHPRDTNSALAATSSAPYLPAPSSLLLPAGHCSFNELTLGHKCGCRRFSVNLRSRGTGHADNPAEAGTTHDLCFCGHHACFHAWEEGVAAGHSFHEAQLRDAHQEVRHEDAPDYMAPSKTSPEATHISPRSVAVAAGMSLAGNCPLEQRMRSTEHPHFPQFRRSPDGLPSTQSFSKLPADRTSDSSGAPRASPSRHFMTQVALARGRFPAGSPTILGMNQLDVRARSPTELATPSTSMVGSPGLRATDAVVQAVNVGLETLHDNLAAQPPIFSNLDAACAHADVGYYQPEDLSNLPTLNERLLAQMQSLRAILLNVPNVSTSISGLARRVETLENTSFGHGSVEELQDRYDHFDGRLLDVEGRLEELEKTYNIAMPHLLHDIENGFQRPSQCFDESTVEVQPDIALSDCGPDTIVHQTQTVSDDQTTTRLEQLERRLSRFEASALPAPNNPWEVEVVLLPWGRALKGIWCSTQDFSQASAPSSLGSQSAGLQQQSELNHEWCASSPDQWLFARACGPTKGVFGRVYERLKSRGFVRTVSIAGNSAREVEFELMWAFEEQLRALLNERRPTSTSQNILRQVLALSNPFIPLRKIHKSSRLRFLTSAELTTPSLWTAEFLNASVFMKAPVVGTRRLFITHPAAYLQRSNSTADWTWGRLRELPRVKLAQDGALFSTSTSGDIDILETCWANDPRLDQPISANASFSSSSSGSAFGSSFASPPPSPQQPVRPAPYHSFPGPTRPAAADIVSLRTGLKANKDSPLPSSNFLFSHQTTTTTTWPSHAHPSSAPLPSTEDLPLSAPPRPISVARKRPATSFIDTIPTSDLTSQTGASLTSTKRRRLSRTPTGDCVRAQAWGFTPRLSREPPSPGVVWQFQQQQERQNQGQAHGQVRPLRPGSLHSVGEAAGDRDRGHGRGTRQRAVTPSAYATPFSYSVGGDTDVDGDSGSDGEDESGSEEGGSGSGYSDVGTDYGGFEEGVEGGHGEIGEEGLRVVEGDIEDVGDVEDVAWDADGDADGDADDGDAIEVH